MSHVVSTAGHVDHGKSTLVRTLTGVDPDLDVDSMSIEEIIAAVMANAAEAA